MIIELIFKMLYIPIDFINYFKSPSTHVGPKNIIRKPIDIIAVFADIVVMTIFLYFLIDIFF